MNIQNNTTGLAKRGLITNAFSVRNPITHTGKVYKKNQEKKRKQIFIETSELTKTVNSQLNNFPNHKFEKYNTQSFLNNQLQMKPQTAPHSVRQKDSSKGKQSLNNFIQMKRKSQYYTKEDQISNAFVNSQRNDTLSQARFKQENKKSQKVQLQKSPQKSPSTKKDFKYRRQLMYLQPQMRTSCQSIYHKSLQEKKTQLYKQISQSFYISPPTHKAKLNLTMYQQQDKDSKKQVIIDTLSTHKSHKKNRSQDQKYFSCKPTIEYITEYGDSSSSPINSAARPTTTSAHCKGIGMMKSDDIVQPKENQNGARNSINAMYKLAKNYKKRPNMAVWRQKLGSYMKRQPLYPEPTNFMKIAPTNETYMIEDN